MTIIALNAGYFVGYGKQAPQEFVLYFIGYTIVTALIGIMTRIIYNTYSPYDPKTSKTQFIQTLDTVSNLIYILRNKRLLTLDATTCKQLSALYIVQNADAEHEALHIATLDLTGKKTLAEALRQIEVYRRNGIQSRVQEIYEQFEAEIKSAHAQLKAQFPDKADMFLLRFKGYAPSKRRGVVRHKGFLNRILSPVTLNDLNDLPDKQLMLQDLEEFYILLHELINGRAFILLNLSKSFRKIKITPSLFSLNDKDKLMLINQLYPLLKNIDDDLTVEAYHALTLKIAKCLSQYIDLYDKGNQRSLEYSNAANFGAIETSTKCRDESRSQCGPH